MGLAFSGLRAEAVEAYTQALALRPGDDDLLRRRGLAYLFKGDHEEALEDLAEAYRLRPADTEALLFLAATYHHLGEDEIAYDQVQEAIHLVPPEPVTNLDSALWIGTEAEANWFRAAAHYYRGRILSNFEDDEGALADFNTALELNPSDPNPLSSRAAVWERMEELTRAVADHTEYLRRVPNANGFHSFAHTCERLGDYEQAITSFGEAVRLEPGNCRHYSCRVNAWLALGRDDKADEDPETIDRINEQSEDPAMSLTLEQKMMVYNTIAEHFNSAALDAIEVTEREFPARVGADLQLALDRLTGNNFDVVRFFALHQHGSPAHGFTQLYTKDRRSPPTSVPPGYIEIDIGEADSVRCLKFGVWLLRSEGGQLPRLAADSELPGHLL